jgi:hypothetical protein
MSIEAMKQALEALKRADKISGYPNNKQTITALCQAIAEAEKQEPVAWIYKPHMELLWPDEVERQNPLELEEYEPLYTHAQPQRQPLTDEQIATIANLVRWSQQYHIDFARAIEGAHGIGD